MAAGRPSSNDEQIPNGRAFESCRTRRTTAKAGAHECFERKTVSIRNGEEMRRVLFF